MRVDALSAVEPGISDRARLARARFSTVPGGSLAASGSPNSPDGAPETLYWLVATTNGAFASTTYRMIPLAMRLQVASARGLVRSKMLGAGTVQSMQSAAVRQGFMPAGTLPRASGWAWVGLGHTMGWPSHRATKNRRLRLVGAP